jgi:serine/threonine protein kinase
MVNFYLKLEEIKEFAGKPLDIWALGVTIYILAFKELPFKTENSENVIELLDLISNAVYIKF